MPYFRIMTSKVNLFPPLWHFEAVFFFSGNIERLLEQNIFIKDLSILE